jgi:hypothetical protein
MKKIIFTNTAAVDNQYAPVPASTMVPDWYKQIDSYMGKEKKPDGAGGTTGTIKKCVPVFDAITGGYIIPTPMDVYVSQKDGAPWYEWASGTSVEFHPVAQALNHPNFNGVPYPKWTNPWAIKTQPGYSVLFIQPMHRESVFTILPGIVDTDTYTSPVNFPFVLNDVKWEGMIPAGTPMAQVIPFKRDSFKMEVSDSQDNLKEQAQATRKLRSRIFDSYRNQFWHRKEYR